MTRSQKNSNPAKLVLKTLCYADIFDYPLTKSELFYFLISKKKIQRDILFQLIDSKIPGVTKCGNLFFLEGKKKLVVERKKRRIESREKMKKASRISNLLSFIPTIKLIGVSGSLSMNNSKKNDDIDLFIIAEEGRLWITRFLVLVTLSIIGERRKKGDLIAENKICPNMFVDEGNLSLDTKNRNLFTAHEVVQLKPLFRKDNIYERFLYENRWVLNFLPNSITSVNSKIIIKNNATKNNFFSKVIDVLELIFFSIQYLYMKSGITSEKISLSSAAFHPRDIKEYTLQLYSLKYRYLSKINMYNKKQEYSRILT